MRPVAAILCSCLVLAACGDDEDDETTPAAETTPPVETQPTAPEPPLTVPDVTVPEEPPATDGDDSGGAALPQGGGGAGDGAISAPGGCGRVAFEHGTDSGAFGISAVGVDCDSARAIARVAGDHGDDLKYEWRGFSCEGARRDEPPLPTIEWVCLRGEDELVKFTAS